jgi:hypothetical protein
LPSQIGIQPSKSGASRTIAKYPNQGHHHACIRHDRRLARCGCDDADAQNLSGTGEEVQMSILQSRL